MFRSVLSCGLATLILAGTMPGHQSDKEVIAQLMKRLAESERRIDMLVLLSNHLAGTPHTYRNPMAYTQLSRGFGIYRPYFRYQYVNDRAWDPVNVLHGLYYGPAAGIRIDYSAYAAFKLEYNRLTGSAPAANGRSHLHSRSL